MFYLQNLIELKLSSNNLCDLVDFHKFFNIQFLQNLDFSDNKFLSFSFNNGDEKFLSGLKNLKF